MTTAQAPPPSKPTEIGWQFVSQYYTFVNKQPSRLHCFYTKNSAFIHGTEGEDEQACYGQHEIHQKILAIGFQDCKVFIHSVDAQASANNGIVVQAIGEMSNNAEPWRKFTQTFFLAEQPNGYFVLNDIFRYLKEDTDEDVEDDADEETAAIASAPPAGAVAAGVVEEDVVPEPAPGVEANYHPNPAQQSRADPSPAEAQLAEAVVEETAPVANGLTNGKHVDDATNEEPAASPEQATQELDAAPPITEPELTPVPEAVARAPSPPVAEIAPSPVQTSTPIPDIAPIAPVHKSVEKPVEPPKPKTWASLAATKSSTWGSNLADSKGVSTPSTTPTPVATPPRSNAQPAPRSSSGPGVVPAGSADANGNSTAAANTITTPQCFVKAVIETVDATWLRTVLTARFGPIKELEIVRTKACAFLEFERLESAKKAIQASLPQHMGGEGGIRIGEPNIGDPAIPNFSRDAPRITIETRKERGDRPPPRPRGGAPPGGDRGAYRGVGRGRGSPRGAAPVNNAK